MWDCNRPAADRRSINVDDHRRRQQRRTRRPVQRLLREDPAWRRQGRSAPGDCGEYEIDAVRPDRHAPGQPALPVAPERRRRAECDAGQSFPTDGSGPGLLEADAGDRRRQQRLGAGGNSPGQSRCVVAKHRYLDDSQPGVDVRPAPSCRPATTASSIDRCAAREYVERRADRSRAIDRRRRPMSQHRGRDHRRWRGRHTATPSDDCSGDRQHVHEHLQPPRPDLRHRDRAAVGRRGRAQSIATNSGGRYFQVDKARDRCGDGGGQPAPTVARAINAAVQHGFAQSVRRQRGADGALPYGPLTEFQVTSPIVGTVNLKGAAGPRRLDPAGTDINSSQSGAKIPQRANVMVTSGFALPGFDMRLRAFRVYKPVTDVTKPTGYKFSADGTALWVAQSPMAGYCNDATASCRNIFTVLPDGSMRRLHRGERLRARALHEYVGRRAG